MPAQPLALTWPQTLAARMRAQRLHPATAVTAADPVTLLRALGGAQAQDAAAGLLSAGVRAAPEAGQTAAGLEAARVAPRPADRTIVRTWAMRGTLHLLPAADAAWIVPFLAPRLIKGTATRRTQLGFNEAQSAHAVKLIRQALGNGPLTRAALREYLLGQGVPNEGQGTVHLIYRAVLEGVCINGPLEAGAETLALLPDWAPLAAFQPRPAAEVLAALAELYLAAFAPAAPPDLAAWAGIALGEARQGFAALAPRLREVSVDGDPMWLLAADADRLLAKAARQPAVRLLPRFDTYLMGYRSRVPALPDAHKAAVFPGGGLLHPTLLVDGAVAGAWQWQRRKGETVIALRPFAPLTPAVTRALPAVISAIGAFLEDDSLTLTE